MAQPTGAYSANLLVQAMTTGDLALFKPYVERVHIVQHQVLAEANHPIRYIYFPEGGIVSLTASTPGSEKTEVGIAGRDGMTGLAILLGSDRSPHDTFVQVDHASALRIDADAFRGVMIRCRSLERLLLRYVQAFLIQSACSTVSNAHYGMEARLARWLLMCHDRMDGDEIALTHEFMSMMIAAQRTAVTIGLHNLEGVGAISSKRSRVIVLNREKLEDIAGKAYGIPEAEYRRLIGPFGRSVGDLGALLVNLQ